MQSEANEEYDYDPFAEPSQQALEKKPHTEEANDKKNSDNKAQQKAQI